MATPDPMVSVVISARGNGDRLGELLRALANQTLPADQFEVVVVDNDPPGPRRPVADTAARTPWPYPIQVHLRARAGPEPRAQPAGSAQPGAATWRSPILTSSPRPAGWRRW